VILRVLLLAGLLITAEAWAQVPVYSYRVVETLPHRDHAFTQGLLVHDGHLYEGTGRYGQSEIARLQLTDGKVLRRRALPDRYFGEGIAIVGDRLFQLTWRANIVFVYDRDSFEVVSNHYHPGEGWGLTYDGRHLILSDGSATLQFIEPEGFQVQRRLDVRLDGQAVSRLNELEYIDGEIWANVWQTDRIVRIDPDSGAVNAIVDLGGLAERTRASGGDTVLNGIAWDAETRRLYVTGKLWSDLFQIELRPATATP